MFTRLVASAPDRRSPLSPGALLWAMDAIRAAGIEVIGLVPRRGGEPAGEDWGDRPMSLT